MAKEGSVYEKGVGGECCRHIGGLANHPHHKKVRMRHRGGEIGLTERLSKSERKERI